MIETLITSKTRIKLLLKFFLNENSSSYLRQLESEFGESSNAIRVELNRFEDAGLLKSFNKGNRKYFQANHFHPLFRDIHNIILKYVGIDQIIEHVAGKLGELDRVFLYGDYVNGKANGMIEFIFVGEKIDRKFLSVLVNKAEKLIKRDIRYSLMNKKEFLRFATNYSESKVLLLWTRDTPGRKT